MSDRNPQETTSVFGGEPALDAATPLVLQESLDLRSYELIQLLGEGGMGEVYRCCDPALGRDLAIKVIKAELRGHPECERRFLREARITGLLQHPDIIAVYNLGRLADGRLHYTMRLVRGRTFAEILKDEAGKPERLPSLLASFEKICQAVAYAHNQGVIHRDLKPANVKVGSFGEVQVLDWGLAKLLKAEQSAAEPGATLDEVGTAVPSETAELPFDVTRLGSGMGTPAYMPPEQALGEWDKVDERADVFALGAILCEMLTGTPAYKGSDGYEIVMRARRGDLAETMARLGKCTADAALKELCRECLVAEREGRPRNADEVARRVADYQAETQERLRQAELERVEAQTRAREEQARALLEQERTREALARVAAERRARQRLLALATIVLLLLGGAGAGVWWMQQVRAAARLRQDQVDHDAVAVLGRSRGLLAAGWKANDQRKLAEAKTEAARAADIARSGGARETVGQQVAAVQTEVQELLDRVQENQRLLDALLDIATPHETQSYREEGSGQMIALAEPSVEEQYAAAFRRRWPDLDIDKQEEAEVAARLQAEPEVVVQGVIAGLDAWMLERRRQQRPEDEWRRLLRLVARLDSSEPRRQLRALVIGSRFSAEKLARLLGGWPSWPALVEMARGGDSQRLHQLRGQFDAAVEPVLTVLLLAQASSGVGAESGAEEVLRLALARRPDEVALLDALGRLLGRQGRVADAIGCLRAARAKHPELGIALGIALGRAGQSVEGEAILRDLLRQQPRNPDLFLNLGILLGKRGKLDEAVTAFREAIALRPDDASSYYNLGTALYNQGRPADAEKPWRKAIELKPDYAEAYCNLGVSLNLQKKAAEAEAAYRKAIAIKPDLAEAHINLTQLLNLQGKSVEAEAAGHKAVALRPDEVKTHFNLGIALHRQGKLVEAEAAYRQALLRKPNFAEVHSSLIAILHSQGKNEAAEAAYRKAIELRPDLAEAYYNYGILLTDQEKPAEAETAYRKAIALQPDLALAHVNLSTALGKQGKFTEAGAACRQAIALQPNLPAAYYNLGKYSEVLGKLADAEAAYRKAIELKADYAEAHCNLGSVLLGAGRFKEALVALRRGHELGSRQPRWAYPSLQWVRMAERLVEMENKLPEVLQGRASPANAGEAFTLASMCQQPAMKRYAASARLYALALTADPQGAADLGQQHRYNAACSAVSAAAGQGADAQLLPDKVVVMFRRWALAWLRDDLRAYAKLAARNDPQANQAIQQRLAHWRSDTDLAWVRDAFHLDRLDGDERAAWRTLWRDVDELAKRAAAKKP